MLTHWVPHWTQAQKVGLVSPHSPLNNCPGKSACAKTTEAKVSSRHNTPQGDGELPETPWVPDNGVSASWSIEEHNSEDNTDHSGNESTQEESRKNAADSDLESASGGCLTYSDMEEVAIRTAQKRFQKAPCNIMRGCLWSEAEVRHIKDSHQAI